MHDAAAHTRHMRRGVGPRLWLGLVLLVLGLLWTLDNLRFIDAGQVLDWWPLVLVALGVTKLVGWGGRVRPFAGAIWIAAGAYFLAHNFDYTTWGMDELWPVGLVVLGLTLVWRSLRARARIAAPAPDAAGVRFFGAETKTSKVGYEGASPSSVAVDTATFSAVAVWAGVGRKATSQAFRGGDFTAIMGGGELDLRGAQPVPGGCVVEVMIVMGGLDIMVPANWTVVNETFVFMGGIEDSRTSSAVDGPNVLLLKGIVFMGGVEIKN